MTKEDFFVVWSGLKRTRCEVLRKEGDERYFEVYKEQEPLLEMLLLVMVTQEGEKEIRRICEKVDKIVHEEYKDLFGEEATPCTEDYTR